MNSKTIQRPWGWHSTVSKNSQCEIHEITVKASCSTELSRHPNHKTSWIVVAGDGLIETQQDTVAVARQQHYLLPAGEWFKIINSGKVNCCLVEIRYHA